MKLAARRADPEAARRLRGFAKYIANIAGIEAATDADLESRAEELLGDCTRGRPAGMVIDALIAASSGRDFAPYTEIVIGEEAQ